MPLKRVFALLVVASLVLLAPLASGAAVPPKPLMNGYEIDIGLFSLVINHTTVHYGDFVVNTTDKVLIANCSFIVKNGSIIVDGLLAIFNASVYIDVPYSLAVYYPFFVEYTGRTVILESEIYAPILLREAASLYLLNGSKVPRIKAGNLSSIFVSYAVIEDDLIASEAAVVYVNYSSIGDQMMLSDMVKLVMNESSVYYMITSGMVVGLVGNCTIELAKLSYGSRFVFQNITVRREMVIDGYTTIFLNNSRVDTLQLKDSSFAAISRSFVRWLLVYDYALFILGNSTKVMRITVKRPGIVNPKSVNPLSLLLAAAPVALFGKKLLSAAKRA